MDYNFDNLNDFRKLRKLRRIVDISDAEYSTKTEYEKGVILQLRAIERRLTYKYDFWAFIHEGLKADQQGVDPVKLGMIHKALCKFIRRNKNLGNLVKIRLPRHHLKTQICTIYYRIWRLMNNPEISAAIVSGTLDLSKDTCRAIRQELINNRTLKLLYPEVIPDWINNERKNKWAETEFSVARKGNYAQASIESFGITATITGKHYEEMSFDDVVTKENSETPEQCQKIVTSYKYLISVVNPRRQKGKIPLMVVGTNYTDNDLYTFLDNQDIRKKFKEFVVPIPYDLEPIWPEFYTKKMLQDIRVQQGPYVFATQYFLDPVPEEQQEFKRSWLRIYHELPQDVNGHPIALTKILIVDPITAKKTSSTSLDRGVVMAAGWDQRHNLYILDYKLYPRATETEMFKGIFELCDKWSINDVLWESVAYQVQGKYNLEEKAKELTRRIRVHEAKPEHKEKDVRIRMLIPHFENGQIFIRYWMDELMNELLRFPFGKTKDIIDALAYGVKHMLAFSHRANPFKAFQGQLEKPFYL